VKNAISVCAMASPVGEMIFTAVEIVFHSGEVTFPMRNATFPSRKMAIRRSAAQKSDSFGRFHNGLLLKSGLVSRPSSPRPAPPRRGGNVRRVPENAGDGIVRLGRPNKPESIIVAISSPPGERIKVEGERQNMQIGFMPVPAPTFSLKERPG